jgi:hypothetical protein
VKDAAVQVAAATAEAQPVAAAAPHAPLHHVPAARQVPAEAATLKDQAVVLLQQLQAAEDPGQEVKATAAEINAAVRMTIQEEAEVQEVEAGDKTRAMNIVEAISMI